MRSSYNVIKGGSVSSNTVYTITPPIIPVKVERPLAGVEDDTIDIEDVKKNAEAIMRDALEKRSSILNLANQEAENIKKNAYDSAYKKGYAEGSIQGREDGLKGAESIRNEALDVMKEAHKLSREYIENQKGEIVNLALCIAEKIIGYQADINDSIIVKAASEAIESAVVKGQLIIRVNPMDYAILDCKRDEIAKAAGEETIVGIIKDSAIKRGGCRVESEESFVDASVDSQLEKIKEALMGR